LSRTRTGKAGGHPASEPGVCSDVFILYAFLKIAQGECHIGKAQSLLKRNVLLAREQMRDSRGTIPSEINYNRRKIERMWCKTLLFNGLRRCCNGLQPVAEIISLDRDRDRYKLTPVVNL
jgi:hypothetical protein